MKIKVKYAKKEENNLLVDSGAQLSLLKLKCIKNRHLIDTNSTLMFKGVINGVKSTTYGIINSGIYINKIFFPHNFHVMRDDIGISNTDGVMGSDFLNKYEAVIDYNQKEIRLATPSILEIEQEPRKESQESQESSNQLGADYSVAAIFDRIFFENCDKDFSDGGHGAKIHILKRDSTEMRDSSVSPMGQRGGSDPTIRIVQSDDAILKARSKNIVFMPISTEEDVVVEKMQLANGIFIGNLIEKPREGKIRLIIVNTRENDISVKKNEIRPIVRYLRNFEVITVNKNEKQGKERKEILKKSINLDHCSTEEKFKVLDVCLKYNEVFYVKGDKLSATNAATHRIPLLPGTNPINTKPYRLPFYQKEALEMELQKLLKEEVIQPSCSPWCSPILLVPKKPDATGKRKWRLCIDFRNVNTKTINDAYPLPNISDILEQLGKASYFSTLDLERGYWQVEMDPQDREITAFKANGRLYEWLRMPMGVKGAAPTFQRMMNNVLLGLQGDICLVYIDDVVLFGDNLEDHNNKLEILFQRLIDYKLKVNPEKCTFLRKEINFLGHIVSKVGICPDPKKVEAVRKFPIPRTQKEIKSFLGLASYYRKFIENFSRIVQPINRLLKKDVRYEWSEECDKAFRHLKEKLTTAPILVHPNFEQQFIVRTDASHFAVGAILSQGKIREDLPICYMSKTLNRHEVRYATVEKELLAIIYAFRNFRPYIYCRKALVITDCQALVWIMNLKNPASRLMRWKMELSEYEFEVIHRPGILNANADALSRIQIDPEKLLGLEPSKNKIELKLEKRISVVTRAALRRELEAKRTLRAEGALSGEEAPSGEGASQSGTTHVVQDPVSERDDPGTGQVPTTMESAIAGAKNQNVVLERDILHYKDKETFKIYVLYDLTGYPFDLVKNHKNLKTIEQGRLITLDDSCVILYITSTLPDKRILSLWDRIDEIILLNNVPQMSIFMSKKDFHLYSKLKMVIEKVFCDTKVTIKIIANSLIQIDSQEEQSQIIKMFHDNIFGGHLGILATIDKIRRQFHWNNMNTDIKNYINECVVCKKSKITTHTKTPMKITSTASRPFEKIIMDVVGPIEPSASGNKYLVTFQDDLSKFAECTATSDITSFTVAKAFVETVICRHGIPKVLLTDNGVNLTSRMFEDVCKILKIDHITSTVYHAQTIGGVERWHRTLAHYLRMFTNGKPDWDQWLSYALFVYNTTKHTSTRFSPHYLVYGFEAEIPINLKHDPNPIYNYEDYAAILKNRLRTAHEFAKENILKSKMNSKRLYDRTHNNPVGFAAGDKVLVYNEVKKHKFGALYSGPYEIVDVPSEHNCLIKIGNKTKLLHKDKLKLVETGDTEFNNI